MKLTVLGSGSTVPHASRTSAGFWLETSGGNILLDCSPTAASRMAACSVDWPNLDAIWISHFHIDHCGGLGPLLQGFKHAPQLKERYRRLSIFGPSGLQGLMDRLQAVNNYRLLEQKFPVQLIEIEQFERFEIVSGVEAVALDTPHTDESHAIRITDKYETSFVYSSDTGFDQKVATFANSSDLFILECTFVKTKPVEKHLELAEAMHLIRKAKPKRAMLTHFYPEWDDVNFADEIKKFEPLCEIIEAKDGLEIEV